jgi:hypothetical protein
VGSAILKLISHVFMFSLKYNTAHSLSAPPFRKRLAATRNTKPKQSMGEEEMLVK